MSFDVAYGPWQIPGLTARLRELHAAPEMHSHGEMAQILNAEFGTRLSRNAVIGKAQRLHLPWRSPRVAACDNRPATPYVIVSEVTAPRGSGPLSLIDLRNNECHWPFGEGPFTFCGKPCIPELPYCPKHWRVAHHEPRGGQR